MTPLEFFAYTYPNTATFKRDVDEWRAFLGRWVVQRARDTGGGVVVGWGGPALRWLGCLPAFVTFYCDTRARVDAVQAPSWAGGRRGFTTRAEELKWGGVGWLVNVCGAVLNERFASFREMSL
jgi:hypothetical protein